ncbi:MAG: GntR family transcriptional regulator [Planctomycetes bacterium]|nr:GntR family transcriptional regulator [Planctomycetota bacterium]
MTLAFRHSFNVDPDDDAPIYRQIVRQVKAAVARGSLVAGDPLPSLRTLAKDLRVSVLTIKQAYDQLEAEQFVESPRGRGTFLRNPLPNPIRPLSKALSHHIPRPTPDAHSAHVDPNCLVELIRQAFNESSRPGSTAG